MNVLNPEVKAHDPWTEEEDAALEEAVAEHTSQVPLLSPSFMPLLYLLYFELHPHLAFPLLGFCLLWLSPRPLWLRMLTPTYVGARRTWPPEWQSHATQACTASRCAFSCTIPVLAGGRRLCTRPAPCSSPPTHLPIRSPL